MVKVHQLLNIKEVKLSLQKINWKGTVVYTYQVKIHLVSSQSLPSFGPYQKKKD